MSNPQQQSSLHPEKTAKLELTVDESFFLELLKKQEKHTIKVKYTGNDAQVTDVEFFANYFSDKEVVQLLESLALKHKIRKNEKGLVLLCPKCGGHSSMPILVCPRCGSTKIGKREDLYHPSCENWGAREEYIDGMDLRCPRCETVLDPDAPEGSPEYYSVSDTHFECQECGESISKTNHLFVCVKCGKKYTSFQSSFMNSVSYSLVSNTEPVVLRNSLETKLKTMKQTPQLESEKLKTPEPTENKVIEKTKKQNDKLMERVSELFKKPKKKKKSRKKKEKPIEVQEEPIKQIPEAESVSETILPEVEAPIVEEAIPSVLLIVEDTTVSEFIVEALEGVKTPISVLHVDDGRLALKELRSSYSVVILDLDLKTIESNLILSEMERWNIQTPIIAFSDTQVDLKFKLDIQSILQKKQKEYQKIPKTVKGILM